MSEMDQQGRESQAVSEQVLVGERELAIGIAKTIEGHIPK
jgi:hypothetical protein